MRILIISPHIPPRHCGVADNIAIQVRELAKRGYKISILTGIENAEIATLNGNADILPLITKWDFRAYRGIKRAIKVTKPDIIHIHYQITMYNRKAFITIVPFLIKTFRKEIKIVTTLHDLNPPYLFPKAGVLRKKLVLFLAKHSDAVIVSNKLDYQELSTKLSQRVLERIYLIPVGSNLFLKKIPNAKKTEIGFKDEEFIMAFLGFVAPDKGIETLLEAFGKLKKEYDNLKLLIIGGKGYSKGNFNSYLQKLDSIIATYAMKNDVIFTDYVDDIKKIELYMSIVDICVFPYVEGVTTRRTTFFTAMSMGIPTVTTCANRNYLPEGLKDGENIRLFKPYNTNELISILKDLIISEKERKALGTMAHTWSLEYSIDKLYGELDAIYKKILFSKSSSGSIGQ
jgi:glycosyltransferase involved in cell wall biosynthesis